ncbi:MAG TPA: hypothetical protein V6C85_11760 [Allocoleopsis sp.]
MEQSVAIALTQLNPRSSRKVLLCWVQVNVNEFQDFPLPLTRTVPKYGRDLTLPIAKARGLLYLVR